MNSQDLSDAPDFELSWLSDPPALSTHGDTHTDFSGAFTPSELTNEGFQQYYNFNETTGVGYEPKLSDLLEDQPSSYTNDGLDPLWPGVDISQNAPLSTEPLSAQPSSKPPSFDSDLENVSPRTIGHADWISRDEHSDLQSPPSSRRTSVAGFHAPLGHVSPLEDDPLHKYTYAENDPLSHVPSERLGYSAARRRRPPSLDLSMALRGLSHSVPTTSSIPSSAGLCDFEHFDPDSYQLTPPHSGDYHRRKLTPETPGKSPEGRPRSVAKMALTELFKLMGLSQHHEEAKRREEEIITEVSRQGFPVGEKAWFRDYDQNERDRILRVLAEKFACWGYNEDTLEKIVRRGAYARRQSNLRRGRRQEARRIQSQTRKR